MLCILANACQHTVMLCDLIIIWSILVLFQQFSEVVGFGQGLGVSAWVDGASPGHLACRQREHARAEVHPLAK